MQINVDTDASFSFHVSYEESLPERNSREALAAARAIDITSSATSSDTAESSLAVDEKFIEETRQARASKPTQRTTKPAEKLFER